MKVGPVDGSVQEVRDLFEDHGLNIESYLEKPPSPLNTRFLVIPIVVFLLFLFTLALLPAGSPEWQSRFIYILSFGSGTWICASTQLRFKNGIATFCVAMGLVLTVLLAAGLISPREAAETVKSLRGK
ncbi:MAG: hypothetical protein NTV89_06670 [Proteobacteria bacterium]|nr:hypothetical protein [Pseudomonadota bacterium]